MDPMSRLSPRDYSGAISPPAHSTNPPKVQTMKLHESPQTMSHGDADWLLANRDLVHQALEIELVRVRVPRGAQVKVTIDGQLIGYIDRSVTR